MYDALYSQNIGLCGFRCRIEDCVKVTRTLRGMRTHALRVHGVKEQRELFDEEKSKPAIEHVCPIGSTVTIKRPERFRRDDDESACDEDRAKRGSTMP